VSNGKNGASSAAPFHERARKRVAGDTRSFLSSTPLFRSLSADRVREVARDLDERHFARNEVILSQGSPSQEVFFIKSGVVEISRLTPLTGEKQTFAFLKQGDTLGELEPLLGANRLATATATAASQVDLLAMKAEEFLRLLETEPGVAVGLSRLLARRLQATTERVGEDDAENRLCLVLGSSPSVGATTVGLALAAALASSTPDPTVYTEYPDSAIQAGKHAAGFDLSLPGELSGFPPPVRATVYLDQLTLNYTNIVIGITGPPDDNLAYLLEHADQIVVVTSPQPTEAEKLGALLIELKIGIRADNTNLYIISNRAKADESALPVPPYADFDIPFINNIPDMAQITSANMPLPLASVASTLADRLRRTNQVSLYIPTTVDVDQALDTSAYVRQTLDFLGGLFGGATSDDAQGVWKSDDAGLVDETIYIVTSFVTQSDLDQHLSSILDYIDRLKLELKQEAMALEVNRKLMLI
jgi:CRP-like cAMP-binding protein